MPANRSLRLRATAVLLLAGTLTAALALFSTYLTQSVAPAVAAPPGNSPADVKPAMSSGSPSSGSPAPRTWLDLQDKAGATPESEHAVELALHWLSEHQMGDGSWSFDHRAGGQCNGQCGDPGKLSMAVNGATGMALLPFIAHGNTHRDGPYTANVHAGLSYLVGKMDGAGRLWEPGGTMYSHALGTLALCEDLRVIDEGGVIPPERPQPKPSGSSYVPRSSNPNDPDPNAPAAASKPAPATPPPGTTLKDKQLQRREKMFIQAAQKAVAYSGRIQDPTHGGWRYDITPDSDLSVTGWQTMALYSASRVKVRMPAAWDRNVERFLDSVQQENGAAYGYNLNEKEATPSRRAIGLLCRVDTGWDRKRQALLDGAAALAKAGPSNDDMYYDYYATNVLHNLGGPAWDAWNKKMQPLLLSTQEKTGHPTGSWSFHGGHADEGGRLLNTALACLILESYYRDKPKLPLVKHVSPGESMNKARTP